MQQETIQQLLERYKQGVCTHEEAAWLESWYNQPGLESDSTELTPEQFETDLVLIAQGLPLYRKPGVVSLWKRAAVAASILLCVGLASLLIIKNNTSSHLVAASKQMVTPGSSKAVLTLSDGSKINLNDAQQGNVAKQGNTILSVAEKGQLVYQSGRPTGNDRAQLNTIETSNGGQYQVVLPDGTHVWLNAASSLRYPASFTGKERSVQLSGEAYFEVAKDKAHPFVVTTNQQTVEVLGTHFNISAYPDETSTQTTLLEGKVQVTGSNRVVVLSPGQGAVSNPASLMQISADTEQAIAWKNGYFSFSNADIKDVMRQISRWYDVQIVYEGTAANRQFSGQLERSLSFEQMIVLLGKTGVHVKAEGRKLIVLP